MHKLLQWYHTQILIRVPQYFELNGELIRYKIASTNITSKKKTTEAIMSVGSTISIHHKKHRIHQQVGNRCADKHNCNVISYVMRINYHKINYRKFLFSTNHRNRRSLLIHEITSPIILFIRKISVL